MGRGKRNGNGFNGVPRGWRPDMEAFIRPEEALAGGPVEKVARPVLRAQARGVIGWCVSDAECAELCQDSAAIIPIYDVPVPVALIAWRDERLSFDNVMRVLAAHDQVMKPGSEVVVDDEDGHFYGVCWCGWTGELCLHEDTAEVELEDHAALHPA
jgi:hypothetical protein